MGKLHICTWHWGTKYGREYIERLFSGVRRNLQEPFTPWVMIPDAADMHLTDIPGCFARLRMFDPAWQARQGFERGDRLVCMDLDSIVTGSLDALFLRPETFMILTGANASNPCPYNGSLWMLRAGYHHDVWADFSLKAAAQVPYYEFPDDQAWMAHKLPGIIGWKAGPQSGVYAFQKPGWPKGNDNLPADARLVVFPGKRDPAQFTHLPWVKERWAA